MQLQPPEVRPNVSSSSSESDFGSFLPPYTTHGQEKDTQASLSERERIQRVQSRGTPDPQLPLHVGICRNCRRLYKRSEVGYKDSPAELNHLISRAGKVFTMMTCLFRGGERNRNTGKILSKKFSNNFYCKITRTENCKQIFSGISTFIIYD